MSEQHNHSGHAPARGATPGQADPTDHSHAHEEGHAHDHGHEHGWWARITGLFGGHSHDHADSVDTALESSRDGIRAVKISLLVLLATAVAQAVLVALTGSVALLADTIHNFSDAFTAVPLWVAFVLGRRPATRAYTYGYGRAEDLAGVFIVVMIAASALVAGYQSVTRLFDPQPLDYPWVVAAAGLVGFAGNELVAGYRIRVGKRIGSAALVADGHHARTDGFTSLAVIGGAAGTLLGFPIADPIVGLLITLAILAVLRDAGREVYRRLMDAVDPELSTTARDVLAASPGVRGVDDLRLRWVGHRLRAEASVLVDPHLDLSGAHEIAHAGEDRLLGAIGKLEAVTVHVSPDTTDPHPPTPERHRSDPDQTGHRH
jgi:cation diffusion facilitator family transporter